MRVLGGAPNPHAENVFDHHTGFTRPAYEAIESQGVGRVVGVSTLERGFPENTGLPSLAMAVDALIESTGVSYRALRKPFFMENLLGSLA